MAIFAEVTVRTLLSSQCGAVLKLRVSALLGVEPELYEYLLSLSGHPCRPIRIT